MTSFPSNLIESHLQFISELLTLLAVLTRTTDIPTMAKIFQKLMNRQFFEFIARFFSPLLGGFRQGYNTQHVLLNFLQYCKNSIDNRGLAGAVFMDFSNDGFPFSALCRARDKLRSTISDRTTSSNFH